MSVQSTPDWPDGGIDSNPYKVNCNFIKLSKLSEHLGETLIEKHSFSEKQ
jgi:hypothetical protein